MNYLLLRRTLCDNPDLMARVTLFAAGLSDRSQDCSVVSLRNNQGNGNVLCGSNPAKSMKELAAREPGVYEVGGWGGWCGWVVGWTGGRLKWLGG
jgi:hypothetical protein